MKKKQLFDIFFRHYLFELFPFSGHKFACIFIVVNWGGLIWRWPGQDRPDLSSVCHYLFSFCSLLGVSLGIMFLCLVLLLYILFSDAIQFDIMSC